MSRSLDEACEAFVTALEQAQEDLNQIRRSLEEEFKEQYPVGTTTPLQLSEKVHALERGVERALEKNAELQKKKNEYVSTMNALLQHNASMAMQLHSASLQKKTDTGNLQFANRENIQTNARRTDNRNTGAKKVVRGIHASSKGGSMSHHDDKHASKDDVHSSAPSLAQVQDIVSRLQEHGLKS